MVESSDELPGVGEVIRGSRIAPTIHAVELPFRRVEKFGPGAAAREENGWLRVPPLF